jgi:hypothetical protein
MGWSVIELLVSSELCQSAVFDILLPPRLTDDRPDRSIASTGYPLESRRDLRW